MLTQSIQQRVATRLTRLFLVVCAFVAFMCTAATASAQACNGNGTDIGNGRCSCFTGYAGSSCDTCAPSYFGYPDCTFCSGATTCNGNGTCTSSGACACAPGYAGPNCNTPNVVSVQPAPLPTAAGVALTITGTSFAGATPTVMIGGRVCSVNSFTATSITCTSPGGQGTGVPVNVAVGPVSAAQFLVDFQRPAIDVVSPTLLDPAGGQLLTINGSNFGQTGTVTIGGNICANGPAGTSWSDSRIVCVTAPGEAADVPVLVNVAGQISGPLLVSYRGPTINTVQPNVLTPDGGTLEIHGTAFGSAGTVRVGDVSCDVVDWLATRIVCTLPPMTVTGVLDVTVTTGLGRRSTLPAAATISSCPEGEILNTLDGGCLPCSPGRYESDNTRCLICAAGTANPLEGQSFCPPCSPGRFSNAGAASCQLCAPGTVAASAGQASCAVCPPGTFSGVDGGIECTACTGNTVQPDSGAIECEACPLNSSPNATRTECEPDPDPLIASVDPSSASADGGEEVTIAGEHFGTPGTVTVGGRACDVVDWSPTEVTCTLPAATATGTAIVVVTTGTGLQGSSDAFSYAPCGAGMYLDVVDGGCRMCAPGTIQPELDAEFCQQCRIGTFEVDNITCEPCAVGTFNAVVGAQSCTPCAPGSFAATFGSVSCEPCERGTFAAREESRVCFSCAAGTYAPALGLTECLPCDAGQFQSVVGAIACEDCPIDTTSAESARFCEACPDGAVAPAGSDTCSVCGDGTCADREVCFDDCGATCGDSRVEGDEECDGENFSGRTCADEGGSGGSLSCTESCSVDTSACWICGNGVVEGDEVCEADVLGDETCASLGFDGGDLACGTGCAVYDTSGCTLCGDGNLTDDEDCDNGDDNSDTDADACRTDCSAASCGDGVTDTGETCDDGDNNSDTVADACRTNCALPTCGDGVTDEGEVCDDGDDNSNELPDACRETCTLAWCGDGVVDDGEGCDDGDDNSDSDADACRTDCTPATCGDGVVDTSEECDDGDDNGVGSCQTDCTLNVDGDTGIGPDAGSDAGTDADSPDAGDAEDDADSFDAGDTSGDASTPDASTPTDTGRDSESPDAATNDDTPESDASIATDGTGTLNDASSEEGDADGATNNDTGCAAAPGTPAPLAAALLAALVLLTPRRRGGKRAA